MSCQHAAETTEYSEGYTRLFPKGSEFCVSDLKRVAAAMARDGSDLEKSNQIFAGYTYLGQFLTHEITFLPEFDADPLRVAKNRRTASLDLDSLYGVKERDSSRFCVDPWDRTRRGLALNYFVLGSELFLAREGRLRAFDLPRDTNSAKPLIADDRNDENALTAQMHGLFMRFHNALVATLAAAGVGERSLFSRARTAVSQHFQSIILSDFLSKVCDPKVVAEYTEGSALFGLSMDGDNSEARVPGMPLEIAGAALRLHPLVRQKYAMSIRSGEVKIEELLQGQTPTPLRSSHGVDWGLFFGPSDGNTRKFNPALLLEPRLSPAMLTLESCSTRFNLAERTLLRGNLLKLPSGQQVASHIKNKGLIKDLLTPCAILRHLPVFEGREPLAAQTPLWLYLMIEAANNGGHCLGEVGSHLLCDTLFHLVLNTPDTIMEPRNIQANGLWLGSTVDAGPRGRVFHQFSMRQLLDVVQRYEQDKPIRMRV